jgi:hypothetical protein
MAPFIMTTPCWIWTRDVKNMASGSSSLIVQKKNSLNIFPIYVQAMEILSMKIFAWTHVTNPPYHQTISCSN